MSYDVQDETAARRFPTSSAAEPAVSGSRPTFGPAAALVMIAGGLVSGALIATALDTVLAQGHPAELQQIASSDLDAASRSLLAGEAVQLVSEARSCRAPLAFLVVQARGKPGGTVRVRSGIYTSPPIRLGAAPERFAIPFPGPYSSGRGQLFVDDRSNGANIFLTPGVALGSTAGPVTINVRWTPRTSC